MPPVNSDFATKTDLVELKTELKADIAELKADIAELKTELKTDIVELRAELTTKTDTLAAGIADLHNELGRYATRADLEQFRSSTNEDLARHIDAAFEKAREWVGATVDKVKEVKAEHDILAGDHKTLAGKQDALQADFDRHRDDVSVHRTPRRR